MNKKLLILIFIIFITPAIGGLYGILHDQLTYHISPEYYTKFKFIQFGLTDSGNEDPIPNPGIKVSAVGFMATWWMGIPIGLVLGLVGLIHRNHKQMFIATWKAILITLAIAFLTGLIGLTYGKFHLANKGVSWWLPKNLTDTKNFIAVGSMHNFSYLGGLFGLIGGIIYSVKRKNSLQSE